MMRGKSCPSGKCIWLIVFLFHIVFIAYGQSASQPTSQAPEMVEKTASGRKVTTPAEKSQPVAIPRFETAPTIDGKLIEEQWNGAAVFKDFYQVQPGDNISPSQSTVLLMGYSADYLFLGFRAADEGSRVRVTVPKRDAIFDDDHVGIVLDTYNDQRRAYQFYFNPLGVQADAIRTEGAGEDYSVDIVMESKGEVSSEGYTVEVAIPFKSIRYKAGKDALWGIHILRRIHRYNDELISWMPISRDNSSMLGQAGHITGLEEIAIGRTLEIIPSFTLSETGRRVPILPSSVSGDPGLLDRGRFINPPIKSEPGLNVKLGLTSTVTLDFTLNPDFAQVEADETVVTANQRFPIFFSEKRPFFLEGIEIFQTPLNAVHTKAIVDPDYAVKLTGKRGKYTFGLLGASDNAPGNFSEEERTNPDILPSIERFLDKNAYLGVLRLKRDVGKESHIGFVGTSYNFNENHNHVGGLDGRFRLSEQDVFRFQVLGTAARSFFFDPELGDNFYRNGNGLGYSYGFSKAGRHFGFEVNGEGRTRDYRADVGFTYRKDTNQTALVLYYNSEPKKDAKLISWRIDNYTGLNYDWKGRMQNNLNDLKLTLNMPYQAYLTMGFTGWYERLFEEEFGLKRTATQAGAFIGDDPERTARKKDFYIYGGMNPSQKYSGSFYLSYKQDAFDFDFGAGPRFPRVSPAALINPDAPLDPGPGTQWDATASFAYQPTTSLRSSIDYIKSRLVRYDTGRVSFDENIFSLRSTYQFTRFAWIRARIDYSTLASAARGQFVFGWTPSPGTSLYIGYNDDININGHSPFTGNREIGWRRNVRTFFIKTSYLFRRGL